ncbi:hypothetical protein AMTRI_Chr09g41970 [Amborella trichopoda]
MHQKMTSVLDFMRRWYFSITADEGNIEEIECIFHMMKMQGVKSNFIAYCSLVNGYL